MRSTILALLALAFLRIVLGLHFFMEGVSHLNDPNWSSVGFRKAAIGPFAEGYQAILPETGNWSGTLGAANRRPLDEVATEWSASVAAHWKKRLDERRRLVPLSSDQAASAQKSLETATADLTAWLKGINPDLVAYRLEGQRLAENEARPSAIAVPFERDRVAKKRRDLAGQAAGWMADADAIGRRLEAAWDADVKPEARARIANASPRSDLWKADRFVSWSLATIGACLVIGLFTKFNAMGAVCFLLTVVATQPFWMAGAQATYNQWVEIAALLVVASLPAGGWCGLDYFLMPWLRSCCPLTCCLGGKPATTAN